MFKCDWVIDWIFCLRNIEIYSYRSSRSHWFIFNLRHDTSNSIFNNVIFILWQSPSRSYIAYLLHHWASVIAQLVKNLRAVQETLVWFLGREDLLEKATHSSILGLPLWLSCKDSACNAGDLGSIPGLGRSPREGKATHSSILAWRSRGLYSHGVTKSLTRLSDFHNNNMTSLEYVWLFH